MNDKKHFTKDELLDFQGVDLATFLPRLKDCIECCKAVIDKVAAQPTTNFQQLVVAIDDQEDELNRLWAPVSHMNSVVSSEELRSVHDQALPMLSEYGTWVGQHKGLYQQYKNLRNSSEFDRLDEEQRRVIDIAIRDFELSGVGLKGDKKTAYGDIQARLSSLSSTFSNQLMDATDGFIYHTEDSSELDGLPEYAVQAARHAAKERELSGYVFTLQIPSYLAVMTFADNASLRQTMYEAYVTRASELGPDGGKYDNTDVMRDILTLRVELARLLGFDNYAQLSLATKMVDSEEQVLSFLNELATKAKPAAERELEELKQFAYEHHQVRELHPWDYAYFSEKLKHHSFQISDEMLKPYFPEDRVLNGLFTVASKLFGIRIEAHPIENTWHPDVSFYQIFDQQGDLVAGFYLDLYARTGKRGGAWMDVALSRRQRLNGDTQLPVAFMVCNFTSPLDGQPAQLTHDEVVTLFHEFGHGLHHMLTKVNLAAISGISGVEWDAVELPSQFLENWCWQAESLVTISGHVTSGEPLPADLLERLLQAKNFQSAMQMLRQLEFSLFDFELHMSDKSVDSLQLLDSIRARIAVIQPPSYNRFANSFGHIFAGGYAAGYYSYKWAEVLSCDAFSVFREQGVFDAALGERFLHEILQRGGSAPAAALFKQFMGREPSINALLLDSGIATEIAA